MATPSFTNANQKAAYRDGFKRGRSALYANQKAPLTRGDLAKMRSQKTPRETRAYILGVRDGAKKRGRNLTLGPIGKGGRGGGGSSSGS
jgi:hypothetical protein